MEFLDLTLPTIAENLALDEALLDECNDGIGAASTLRLWEATERAVIVGRSSRLETEVNLAACRTLGVPFFRRVSGGAAVVVGPGCLMYAVILRLAEHPELKSIDRLHRYVLGRMVLAMQPVAPRVTAQGTCDLTLGEQKFSGNSTRMKRNSVLYHGTLLYNFPLEEIGRLLNMPPRTPDYRSGREHDAFVANLPISAERLKQALRTAWQADATRTEWPRAETARLAVERYGQPDWNAAF